LRRFETAPRTTQFLFLNIHELRLFKVVPCGLAGNGYKTKAELLGRLVASDDQDQGLRLSFCFPAQEETFPTRRSRLYYSGEHRMDDRRYSGLNGVLDDTIKS
jgi:hypothetical protein